MLILSQNKTQIVVLENLSSIFSDASAKIRCNYNQNGGGSELARYDNREQCAYVMEYIAISYENGSKTCELPSAKQVAENMAVAKAHRSNVSTSKNRHGGS